jgi:hypothetical protein
MAAGLSVHMDGGKLVIRGPRSADRIARALLEHKAEVVAQLRTANWELRPDTRGRLGFQSPDAPVPFPAWEDLPEHSKSALADPTAGACWWCGRREWWRSIHGAVVCGYCHPPSVPGLVAEWLAGPESVPDEQAAAQEARRRVSTGMVDTQNLSAGRPTDGLYGALPGREDGQAGIA